MSNRYKNPVQSRYNLRSRANGSASCAADPSYEEPNENIFYVSDEGIVHLHLETTMRDSDTHFDSIKKTTKLASCTNRDSILISPISKRLKIRESSVGTETTQESKPIYTMQSVEISAMDVSNSNSERSLSYGFSIFEGVEEEYDEAQPMRMNEEEEEAKPIYRMQSLEISTMDISNSPSKRRLSEGLSVLPGVAAHVPGNPRVGEPEGLEKEYEEAQPLGVNEEDDEAQAKEKNILEEMGLENSVFGGTFELSGGSNNSDSSKLGASGSGISISTSGFGSNLVSETRWNSDTKVEFFNFKKNRQSFKKCQVWAFYDEFGMPRHYARIDHDSGPDESVRFSYLDYNDKYVEGGNQSRKASGALLACGAFTVYRKADPINASKFSHLLHWSQLIGECTYLIYPRKGDVWAISKDHSLNLTPLHLGSPKIQKFQMVEVLEDYQNGDGTRVVYLVKVKGKYRSLFRRYMSEGVEVSFHIPFKDSSRFSHQVPSFRVTGDESINSCLELDPSSLPLYVDDFTEDMDPKIDDEYLCMRFLDLKLYNSLVYYKYHTLWALYDTQYKVPIKYAKINHTKMSGSVVSMSWLEPDPTTEDQKRWYRAGLPISCGRFRSGGTVDAQDNLVFSHPVPLKLASNMQLGKYNCIIYPRTGDVWGIYKDWDMKWSSYSSMRRGESECEIVEIDGWYNNESVVKGVYLVRVEGFKSLFRRKTNDGVEVSVEIPSSGLFRFSHQIMAYRIRAVQDGGILERTLVLDPRLVCHNVRESFLFGCSSLSESLTIEGRSRESQSLHLCSRYHVKEEKSDNELGNQKKTDARSEFNSTYLNGKGMIQFPSETNLRKQGNGSNIGEQEGLITHMENDREFHDLNDQESLKCFELDQIWAMCDDLDGMPRSYACINGFLPTELKVEATLLEPHPMLEAEMRWVVEENLPMSCGTFRTSSLSITKEISAFSHQVFFEGKTVKRSFYKIYPRKGEIWAIYKDWDPNWTCSDFKNHFRYSMVEVISDFTEEAGVTIAGLIRVEGFCSVYQRHLHEGFGLFKRLSRTELLRFSHQIPAVRMSGDERDGVPEGSWKLDNTVGSQNKYLQCMKRV